MKIKHYLALPMALLLMGSLFTGCGSKDDSSMNDSVSSSAADDSSRDDKDDSKDDSKDDGGNIVSDAEDGVRDIVTDAGDAAWKAVLFSVYCCLSEQSADMEKQQNVQIPVPRQRE